MRSRCQMGTSGPAFDFSAGAGPPIPFAPWQTAHIWALARPAAASAEAGEEAAASASAAAIARAATCRDTTASALLGVADAVDRAGEVVADEQRPVLHHGHVDRTAAVDAVLVEPALGEDAASVGCAIRLERYEVDQGT